MRTKKSTARRKITKKYSSYCFNIDFTARLACLRDLGSPWQAQVTRRVYLLVSLVSVFLFEVLQDTRNQMPKTVGSFCFYLCGTSFGVLAIQYKYMCGIFRNYWVYILKFIIL